MEAAEIDNLLSDIDFDIPFPNFEVEFKENYTETTTPDPKEMANKEITEYIEANKNVNTKKKTISDLKMFHRWCKTQDESRDILEIPPEELDQLMSLFFIKVRKQDGSAYEPGTLTGVQRSIDRYLRENRKSYSPISDRLFELSRSTLASRRKELRKDGKGRKPNKALGLTEDEVEQLYSY